MAAQQARLHEIGRTGEKIAQKIVGGRTTRHKAPFDIVDFKNGIAYEVKTMPGCAKDLKIHIADSSYHRKVEFAGQYGLQMVLIAVVIHSPKHVDVYSSELKQHIRVHQMRKVA